MNRAFARRWCFLAALLALVAGVVSVSAGPDDADAREPVGASLTLTVEDRSDDLSMQTVAVAVDPGDSGLVALTASLVYDPASVEVLSCAVSEAGACNDLGAAVKFTVFSLTGLAANPRLLTVDVAVPDGSALGGFALEVEMAIGGPNDGSIDVAVPAPQEDSPDAAIDRVGDGSLTGDVIAAQDQIGRYAIEVCATHTVSAHTSCTTTNGWGAWRIDGLAEGDYVIDVSDPAGELEATVIEATVSGDEITTGLDAALVPTNDGEPPSTEPAGKPLSPPARTEPKHVVFEASIAGIARALATNQPLAGVQICATQPLVLHQRCATTAGDGSFVLEDLSSGNYWVTGVDPLGRAEDARPRLVGVVGDQSHRTGVVVSLPPR